MMENGKTPAVAAVVITYNRLALLKECIASLRKQTRHVDEIIVVNNSSTDGTEEWLRGEDGLTVVTQGNSGSSGGQFTGIKTAVEKGHDWIWCMDDDAEPHADALEKLLEAGGESTLSAIAGTVVDEKGNMLVRHRGVFVLNTINTYSLFRPLPRPDYTAAEPKPLTYASFVGILINRNAVHAAGLPRKELFIYQDDVEYCLRLNRYGGMLLVPQSRIIHKERSKDGKLVRKRFLWRTSPRIPFQNDWSFYYRTRNYAWICLQSMPNRFYRYGSVLTSFVSHTKVIVLFEDEKLKRLAILLKSYRDAWRNTL